MKIAIIGAGFAGLSACYHLLNQETEVHVFDKLGIGKGASGISAGLLHPYKRDYTGHIPNGDEYFKEALKLINISEEYEKEVILKKGILKLATTSEEVELFSNLNKPDTEWWSEERVKSSCEYFSFPALFVKSGILVSPINYLNGLWKACEKKGARLHVEEITNLSALSSYDHIIITTGSQILQFPSFPNVRLRIIKGQILVLDSKNIEPLSYPINGGCYLVQHEPNSLVLGATYERKFTDLKQDLEIAKEQLIPKLGKLSSVLKDLPIKGCFSEGRVYASNNDPLIARNGNVWALTGFGSKGLLYHGFFGRRLANELLSNKI